MANGFSKPYFGENTNPATSTYNGWGGGWGMFNPFQQLMQQANQFDPTRNGGLQGLTPEVLQQIRNDFQEGDFNTKASLWRNQALRQFLEPLIGGDKDALNQLEMASWTASPLDMTKYGTSQMRFTEMMKARQAGGGQAPSGTNGGGGGGYNPTYNPTPAGGSNPYPDYTQLYRDPGGMIHDFGDNPAPTTPTTQIPWQGFGTNTKPWMGGGHWGRNQNTRQPQTTPETPVPYTRTGTPSPGGVPGAYPGGPPRTNNPPVTTPVVPAGGTPPPPPNTYVDPMTGFIPGYSQQ